MGLDAEYSLKCFGRKPRSGEVSTVREGTTYVGTCSWPFSTSVKDSSFYSIEITGLNGAVEFSRSELVGTNWEADITNQSA